MQRHLPFSNGRDLETFLNAFLCYKYMHIVLYLHTHGRLCDSSMKIAIVSRVACAKINHVIPNLGQPGYIAPYHNTQQLDK